MFLFACLCAGTLALHAQPCTNPQSQIDIHGNNIRARLLNGGDLFWDFSDAQFLPNYQAGQANPATIFAGSLWIGGIEPAGNIKLAAVTYRSDGKPDFFAGPLDPDGFTTATACSNWDRHFKVTGAEIDAFLKDLPNISGNPQLAVSKYPAVMGWPARGNAYFAGIHGFDLPFAPQALAGFYDADSDGVYNPLQGDYPAVQLQMGIIFVPAEIVWCVFNDQGAGASHASSGGAPFPAEVQLTAWAFNCGDQPVLNNTLFTSHKIIYRGVEPVDSCFIGIWTDFDIGCYTDDYLGCNPELHCYYGYNTDAVDGGSGMDCPSPAGNIPTFGALPPVQSVTFLSRSLDKFIPVLNSVNVSPPSGTTDPIAVLEFYRYLTGYWRDGSPLTYGGLGWNTAGAVTNHAFPDDPADPNGWSMCTAGLPSYDQRGLGIHKVGALAPGQIEEMVTAWTYHPFMDAPCSVGNAFADIESLHTHFANKFTGVCSPLTSLRNLSAADFSITPNPTTDEVTIQFQGLSVTEIRLMSNDGRVLQSIYRPHGETVALNLSGIPAGIYFIQVSGEQGRAIRKLVVER